MRLGDERQIDVAKVKTFGRMLQEGKHSFNLI